MGLGRKNFGSIVVGADRASPGPGNGIVSPAEVATPAKAFQEIQKPPAKSPALGVQGPHVASGASVRARRPFLFQATAVPPPAM